MLWRGAVLVRCIAGQLRRRNFYTDREKLMGKCFPTQTGPHADHLVFRTCIEREPAVTQRPTPRPFPKCYREYSGPARKEAWWLLSQALSDAVRCHLLLHEGSKFTRVDTVWSMRHASCTNLDIVAQVRRGIA